MSEKLTFEDVCLYTAATPANNTGTLKMAPSGLAWRSQDKHKTITVLKEDMVAATWRRGGNGEQLTVNCKENAYHRLDGLEEQDLVKIQKFFKNNFGIEVAHIDTAVKGFHWGDVEVQGKFVNFLVDGKIAFDVPIAEVNQSVLSSNKMEVAVEFQQPEKQTKQEMLYEMRFFFTKDPDQEVTAEEGSETVAETRAQKFHKRLAEKTDKSRFSGASVATFPELLFLTPRGRYQMEFFPKFVKLHGPTHNYNVMYSQIQRIFLVPKPDGFFYVLGLLLNPPVRQGQTTYPFLMVQIPKEEETDLQFNLTDDQLEEKYHGRLTPDMLKGLAIETLPRLLKIMAEKKVICASNDFRAVDDSRCVKCALKASSGVLYPLDSGFLFIHKPAIFVRYGDVSLVTLDRQAGSSSRSFELIVATQSGAKHSFTNIRREEYNCLLDFFKAKGLNVDESEPSGYGYGLSTGAHDGYLDRGNGEGEEDSEEDDDYNPDAAHGSDSDVAEEFDSEAKDSEESDAEQAGSEGDASDHAPKSKEKKRRRQRR